jgi:hypothetical protein
LITIATLWGAAVGIAIYSVSRHWPATVQLPLFGGRATILFATDREIFKFVKHGGHD